MPEGCHDFVGGSLKPGVGEPTNQPIVFALP
jgi:hypothetical protein